MNLVVKHLRTIIVGLVLLVVFFIVADQIGKEAASVETKVKAAQGAANSLHGMIAKDLSDFGESAPERARAEEARLLDWRAAEAAIRKRVVFVPSADYLIQGISDDELPSHYSKIVRELETRLRTTFWKPRVLAPRGGAKVSSVGQSFALSDDYTRDHFSARLWQLDVLRRVLELAESYRIASVESFKFNSNTSDLLELAPSSRELSTVLQEITRAGESGMNPEYPGYDETSVEDPFSITYQTFDLSFLSGMTEASNFLSDLGRESGGSGEASIGRSLFPISWEIERDERDLANSGRVMVKAKILAVREVRGSNIEVEESLRRVMPTRETFLPSARD